MRRLTSTLLRSTAAILAAAGTLLSLCGAPFLSVFAWWEALTAFGADELFVQVAASCTALCLAWFATFGAGAALMALSVYTMRAVDWLEH